MTLFAAFLVGLNVYAGDWLNVAIVLAVGAACGGLTVLFDRELRR